MKKELIDYARVLNAHDTKNLSQKLTKTMEEVGELARVILPFEDASGTLHRFVERNQILEEAIDVILCAQSIAHELGFTDEEVDQMAKRKLAKWGELQAGEDALGDKPIPYEIHITVSLSDGEQIPFFVSDCEDIGVKPIVLDLQVGANTIQDVMTSSVHFGSNRSAYEEMCRITEELRGRDFNVVREKIETVPWHPASPKTNDEQMPKDCYFESHLAVVVTSDEQHRWLQELASSEGAHTSSNAFKKYPDGRRIVMVTLRDYDVPYRVFKQYLSTLRFKLESAYPPFQVDKEIIEFSIYDTKVSHDAEWINA